MKNDNALFYTCSLIEYIGRQQKQRRAEVVTLLGRDTVKRIYDHADVFHCEPIAKTADDFITMCNIPIGSYDNVGACKYDVPDYWTIGKVYERLIEDIGGEVIDSLFIVYSSWIDEDISNYNSDFFYQPRDYIHECYKCGDVL